MDLLGHSAGRSVVQLYAARFPHRVARLVLVTPSLRAVGLTPVGVAEALATRSGERWYADARAAFEAWSEAVKAGTPSEKLAGRWTAVAPLLYYGRWDERARAHSEADAWERSHPGTDNFYAGFEPDVPAIQAALKGLDTPVQIIAGSLDLTPPRRRPTSSPRSSPTGGDGAPRLRALSVAGRPGRLHPRRPGLPGPVLTGGRRVSRGRRGARCR